MECSSGGLNLGQGAAVCLTVSNFAVVETPDNLGPSCQPLQNV